MLWQLLALHLEVSFFDMQPSWLTQCPFIHGPHSQLNGGSKNSGTERKERRQRSNMVLPGGCVVLICQLELNHDKPVYSSLSATSHFFLPTSTNIEKSSSEWFRKGVKWLFFIQNLGKPGVEDPQTVLPGTTVRYPARFRYFKVQQCIPLVLQHYCIGAIIHTAIEKCHLCAVICFLLSLARSANWPRDSWGGNQPNNQPLNQSKVEEKRSVQGKNQIDVSSESCFDPVIASLPSLS